MIHFYVGKPRNGKSLRVMMKIIDVLINTQQHVVTNMVLRLDELQEYLDSLGHNIHVLDRVTIIDDEQTRNFWRYREHGYVLPVPEGYGDKKDRDPENISYVPLFENPRFRIGGKLLKPDGAPGDMKGTCYVIDEVQNLWPARGWQGTGHHIAFYLSQHGKLGDTVYFITQNVKNVDRILYSVAQDFTYCRNHRMEKHGRFRGENKFSAKTYPGPVQDGSEWTPNDEEYKLDLAVARCYDTSAGVGMPGGGTADAGFRAKGIPLKTVWVGLAAVLVLVFCVFKYGVPMFTNAIIAPGLDPKGQIAGKAQKGKSVGRVSSGRRVPEAQEEERTPALVGAWVTYEGGVPRVQAITEDGITIPSRLVSAFNLDGYPTGWVEAQGVRYYLKRQAKVVPAAIGEGATVTQSGDREKPTAKPAG